MAQMDFKFEQQQSSDGSGGNPSVIYQQNQQQQTGQSHEAEPVMEQHQTALGNSLVTTMPFLDSAASLSLQSNHLAENEMNGINDEAVGKFYFYAIF